MRTLAFLILTVVGVAGAQSVESVKEAALTSYRLGPDDQVVVSVADSEEIANRQIQIDTNGEASLPLLGRLRVGGLTVQQFEQDLATRLKTYYKDPQVTVTISEFRSQPVSVIGAVKQPGVHQLRGTKTLVEILSLAGGLRDDAGNSVKVTRRKEWGPIPLTGAVADPSGEFTVGEVALREIMMAQRPEANIIIRPNDVITVPKADLVYVIGEVMKAGGFVLAERGDMSVLQAISMAGGMTKLAGGKNAKILRPAAKGGSREEIAVDLRKILEGKAQDISMQPEDILFVPTNVAKNAGIRTAEAAVQMVTGVVIWRGARF
jgi:polysaccharide export outer membrane protein